MSISAPTSGQNTAAIFQGQSGSATLPSCFSQPAIDARSALTPHWRTWADRITAWPKPAVCAFLLTLVGVVGWIDYQTGFEVSVSLLYLVPIGLATWAGGRSLGNVVVLVSAAVWLIADYLSGHTYGHWLVPAWNSLTLSLSFLVVVALLASLRETNDGLEQTVARRTDALRAENEERRRAEGEVRRALGELRETHLELQRTQLQLIESAKLESVGRLAAGVAHEVKNPLMTLSLGADYFLECRRGSAEEVQLAKDMKTAVHRASDVINILLDYSRPGALKWTREDIHGVLENSLALVRHQLNRRQIQTVREFDTTLPLLPLDRTRLEHVFVNLFTNALHEMPSGGTLTIRTLASPKTNGSSDSTGITVQVDDTGHGIASENAGKLLDPFFTTKPPGQGTGLGLAIVHKIMEMHGGSIHLSNHDGGGARVSLQFNPHPERHP